jgi:hypothetical protein
MEHTSLVLYHIPIFQMNHCKALAQLADRMELFEIELNCVIRLWKSKREIKEFQFLRVFSSTTHCA